MHFRLPKNHRILILTLALAAMQLTTIADIATTIIGLRAGAHKSAPPSPAPPPPTQPTPGS